MTLSLARDAFQWDGDRGPLHSITKAGTAQPGWSYVCLASAEYRNAQKRKQYDLRRHLKVKSLKFEEEHKPLYKRLIDAHQSVCESKNCPLSEVVYYQSQS